jgi:hypothetical protein
MDIIRTISQLPTCNKQELTLLIAAAQRLLGDEAVPGPLFDVLVHASGNMIPFRSFSRSRAYKTWVEHEALVMHFLGVHWPTANKVTLNSLKHFLFKMLVDDLRKRKIRVTIGTLALNAGQIPGIFEQSFPGYLSAGLAPMVMMMVVGKNGKSS